MTDTRNVLMKMSKNDLVNIIVAVNEKNADLVKEKEFLKNQISVDNNAINSLSRKIESNDKIHESKVKSYTNQIDEVKISIATYIEIKYPNMTFRNEFDQQKGIEFSQEFLLLERVMRLL